MPGTEAARVADAMIEALSLAREKSPGATDKQAVQKLTEDVERLRDQASRVRSLEIVVEVVVFGQWTAGAPPTSTGMIVTGGAPDVILQVETPGGHIQHISLYASGYVEITASGADQATITYRAATPSGAWPIGEPSSDLSMLVGGKLALIGVGSASFTNRQAGIRSFKLQAFINGVERMSHTSSRKSWGRLPPGDHDILLFSFQSREASRDAT